MAPGFKFPPPPPPPPPKAPSNDAPNSYTSQRGGQGRGGNSGRGRGSFRGNSRGGYQHTGGDSNGGGYRGGRGGTHSYRTPNGTHEQPQPPHYNSSKNSNFVDANPNPPVSVDPGALVQAMAFMATPAGMQSMAAFANHMAAGNPPPSHSQPAVPQQPPASNQSPSSQYDSRKRKRGDRAGHWHTQQQQSHVSTAKPPRAKAKAAPSVPGFGFSLPLPSAAKAPTPSKVVDSQNKKRPNLGLTQLAYDEDSDEEEQDEDEEAAFASKWAGKGITFEHNGDVISLETGAEVVAYIKDRKRNYPTQARIAAKAQEAQEKRAHELEFLRKVKGASRIEKTRDESNAKSQRQKTKANDQPRSAKPKLDELRERVVRSAKSKPKNSMPPANSTQPAVDLGVGYASGTESDADGDSDTSSILSESSVVSSSDSSDENESDAIIDDDDAPPEAQSSKVPIAPVVPPPAPKRPERTVTVPDTSKSKVCSQWKATGKCKYKYCKYRHEEDQPKVVSLYERMVEMELDKADRLALEAIKYLGRNGFLG